MNKRAIINFLLGVSIVSSCTNEELVVTPSIIPQAETPDVILNVNESIDDFDSFILKLRSARTIKLVTSDFTRVVANNGVDSYFQADGSERLLLSNDSVAMILTDNYIALTSNLVTEQNCKNPTSQHYLIHKSKEYISEYNKFLVEEVNQLVKTRGLNGDSPTVALHSDHAISLNQVQAPLGTMQGQSACCSPTRTPDIASSSGTILKCPQMKSEFSFSDSKAIPETRGIKIGKRAKDVLRIWLIRHKGYRGFQHEITWQQNDVRAMIKDLNPKVKVEFYTRNSDFIASSNAYETLKNFQGYVKGCKTKCYDWSGGVGKDVFILVSYGSYSPSIAGLGILDTYKLNREENPYAFGISAISPIIAPKTLAHELGHIIGAEHTSYTWWEGWSIFKFPQYDIMSTDKPFRRSLIRDPKNVKVVRNNLKIVY